MENDDGAGEHKPTDYKIIFERFCLRTPEGFGECVERNVTPLL